MKKIIGIVAVVIAILIIGICFFAVGSENKFVPDKPLGITNGVTEEYYSYTTRSIDPDGDDIQYHWDWNDGTNIVGGNWSPSGGYAMASHTWSSQGTYNVRVKAYDGELYSDWSSSLEVIIGSAETRIGTITGEMHGPVIDIAGISFGTGALYWYDGVPPDDLWRTFSENGPLSVDKEVNVYTNKLKSSGGNIKITADDVNLQVTKPSGGTFNADVDLITRPGSDVSNRNWIEVFGPDDIVLIWWTFTPTEYGTYDFHFSVTAESTNSPPGIPIEPYSILDVVADIFSTEPRPPPLLNNGYIS